MVITEKALESKTSSFQPTYEITAICIFMCYKPQDIKQADVGLYLVQFHINIIVIQILILAEISTKIFDLALRSISGTLIRYNPTSN